MKYLIAVAFMVAFTPANFAAAAPSLDELEAQIKVLQVQVANLHMMRTAQVLGVSTNNLFQVTSNSQIIAQSYVTVTPALATSWCADMVAVPAFKNTAITCTHEGSVIFKK